MPTKCAITKCGKEFSVVFESHKPKIDYPVIVCHECMYTLTRDAKYLEYLDKPLNFGAERCI